MTSKNKSLALRNRHILSGIIFFLIGCIATYFVITLTNFLPLNYQEKYDQVYNSQTRERGWETYVDLVNGFVINYPEGFRPDSPAWAFPDGVEGGLLSMGNGANDLLNSSRITLQRQKSSNNLLDFVKQDDQLYIRGMTFKRTTFKGDQAVIANFTMNEKLHKEINTFYSLNRHRELEPIGYEDQRVFILHQNYIYKLNSGSLFSETESDRFNKILNSLTFID